MARRRQRGGKGRKRALSTPPEEEVEEEEEEEESRPYPMLLLPGETLGLYDLNFKRWLSKREVSMDSLQNDPSEEQHLHLKFIESRVQELQEKSSRGKRAPDRQCHHTRSPSELLSTRIMSEEQFWNQVDVFGPDGKLCLGQKLAAIPVLLRSNESLDRYEENFRRWLNVKNVKLEMLQRDPEEERRFRQSFAYCRASPRAHYVYQRCRCSRSPQNRRSRSRSRSRGHSRNRLRRRSQRRSSSPNEISVSGSSQSPRSSETQSIERPQRKRKRLSDEEDQRASSSIMCSSEGNKTHGKTAVFETDSKMLRCVRSWAEKATKDLRCCFLELEQEISRLPIAHQELTTSKTPITSTWQQTQDQQIQNYDEVIPEINNEQSPNAILYMATEVLSASARGIPTEDPTKPSLTRDFIRLNKQIVINERAMEDSIAYVKMIIGIDKSGAGQHLDDVKELTVSINQEKRRRDSVLAAVIAHQWSSKKDELNYQVRSEAEVSSISYDKLASTFTELEQKREDLAPLQAKVKNRLSWLIGEHTGRDIQFRELKELTSKLAAETTVISKLEAQCNAICVALMKSNEVVYRMAVDMIEDMQTRVVATDHNRS